MKRLTLPSLVLIALLTMSGCSASLSGSDMQTDAGGGESAEAPSEATDGGAPSFGEEADEDREIITTGSVHITAKDPVAASEEAVRIVESTGGRIDARTEWAPTESDNGRAVLTLRIPAGNLTRALGELKQLGTVERIETGSDDVTRVGKDLDARIAALSTSVDRLLELLAVADDTEVLLQLETAITERQGELDSLRSQRRLLSDQVSMSTIRLEITSVAAAPVSASSTPLDALAAGFDSFVAFFTGLLFVLSFLLPWLVLAGVTTLVVLWLVRRRRKPVTTAVDSAS